MDLAFGRRELSGELAKGVRKSKIPQGNCLPEEAMNLPGTTGMPGLSSVQFGIQPRGDGTDLAEMVVERGSMLCVLHRG